MVRFSREPAGSFSAENAVLREGLRAGRRASKQRDPTRYDHADKEPKLFDYRLGHRSFQTITDEQLLALVSPRPAVLVRVGLHRQELIFADPADQNELPVN